jgi:3-hydroxybutyryl-CoA dehydrogenase
MGIGIAQLAAQAGSAVVLFDAKAGQAQKARDGLLAQWKKLLDKGRITPEQLDTYSAAVGVADSISDLADCDLVIEAVAERLDVKIDLFRQLEAVVSPAAVLATNTSSLSVTAIGAGLQQRGRFAGLHFFNPVPLMKVVEVIGGLYTDADTCTQLAAYVRQMGHTPVQAADTPGFIVNHAGRGYGTEGLRLLAEGVATVQTLDDILRDTAGFRLGPCELMDLTGLDVSHPVMESIYQQYYEEPRFRPQGLTRQMVTAGAYGRKVGQGFYRYDADGKKLGLASAEAGAAPAVPAAEMPNGGVWLSRARPELAERLANLIAAAGIPLETGERPSDTALCIVTPLGDDATTCCVREHLDGKRTVGVESLLDLSRRRVVMATPATDARYVAMACGLFGATGTPVSVIRDSAGLVTQRVVAHIVNIASEIAQQGIADPEDIDRAVTLGLGYPLGPLAWGDQIGAATVLTILKNLEEQTGDPRYRASPWLQRRALLGLSLRHKGL